MVEIFERHFQLHIYELDFRGKAKPQVMLNFLQEAANLHAARLGFSVEALRAKNQTWVLSRYHVLIKKFPSWKDRITVRTWPSGVQGSFAIRDFEMLSEEGKQFAVATSSWVLLNLKTKRPERVESILPELSTYGKRALHDQFSTLPILEKADLEQTIQVRMSDLDVNRHVNHVIYIQWALETVPREILEHKQPVEIEAGYRAEAFYGDQILSRIQTVKADQPTVFLHQLIRKNDGADLTRLRTTWR